MSRITKARGNHRPLPANVLHAHKPSRPADILHSETLTTHSTLFHIPRLLSRIEDVLLAYTNKKDLQQEISFLHGLRECISLYEVLRRGTRDMVLEFTIEDIEGPSRDTIKTAVNAMVFVKEMIKLMKWDGDEPDIRAMEWKFWLRVNLICIEKMREELEKGMTEDMRMSVMKKISEKFDSEKEE